MDTKKAWYRLQGKDTAMTEDMFKDLPKGGETPLNEYFDYLKKKWPCSEETLRTGIISEETQKMTEETE